jgi:hypothetical protein
VVLSDGVYEISEDYRWTAFFLQMDLLLTCVPFGILEAQQIFFAWRSSHGDRSEFEPACSGVNSQRKLRKIIVDYLV